ncbi:transport protein sec71 [Plectosphaerella cucumerina]|uniref:Transport protein sec71 n=1 Tax=Plectosphaerella cucumerina TaxID=40658 RepID=A0A8K0TU42_9PEZI|nr:transport protein sec71 [Plectosphaerella cucumerina]
MSSIKFLVSSLEAIAASKDAQRHKQLTESLQKTLAHIKENDSQQPDPEIVFAPLHLATKTGYPQLITSALDCIGKLISYSHFATATPSASAESENPPPPLIERCIDTICDCFQGETTPVEIQLQIVKSLLAAVLNDKIVVHGAGLLKAVRQVYNVFLLSRSTANQQMAQGTLAQMVGTVFERVKTRLHMKEARLNLSKMQSFSNITFDPNDQTDSINGAASPAPDAEENGDEGDEADAAATPDVEPPNKTDGNGKLTLKDLENRKSFDDSALAEGPTRVSQIKSGNAMHRTASQHSQSSSPGLGHDENTEDLDAEDEVYIRDAYLVFRSFCNLSTKVLPPAQLYDLRGQPMRSKLISLHLIHTLLNNHISVFTSPFCTIQNTKTNEVTTFMQAIKYYICLSITRNGASSVDRIFDVCSEIFWLILKFMREQFKLEIAVFLNEIYLAVLARKTAPISQKVSVINILNRFCADSRGLVEIYLNYDCAGNVDNIFQTIIEDLSKFSTAAVAITPAQEQQYEEKAARQPSGADWQLRPILPPPLSVAQIVPPPEPESEVPKEYIIKRISLDALVESLRSMVDWSASVRVDQNTGLRPPEGDEGNRVSEDMRPSIEPSLAESSSRFDTPVLPSTPIMEDDPAHLEKIKAKKTALDNAVRQFNFKPKRGVALLIKEGFIASDGPEDIARFLLKDERLDKAQIGEYLGEGEPKNIEIMHAFVDAMDFTKKRFVDALRTFLQSFRLPGEAQKIDRFMLKFANRYVMGNPNAFANADTAYVLAYSVVMLNTDLHSSKIARRMTREDFIKNNRGINDNADLPDEYLVAIYDEIEGNEIVLKSEQDAAAAAGNLPQQSTGLAAGLGQAFSNMGRDLQREAYLQQAVEIASRSEQLFKNLLKTQRRNAARAGVRFIPATSYQHIGPMFDVTWMSYFSALSSQMQKAHNIVVNKLCLEGMRLATKIACTFDLATPREAFVSALRNTTNLNNPQDMLAKHVESLKVLLELGQTDGNTLRSSWKDVLMCISQLDRLQLISGGADESAIPDVANARFERQNTGDSRKSTQSKRSTRPRANTGPQGFSAAIAQEARSDELVKAVDRIFANTANLDGDAIVFFTQALTEVSWDEIKVSGSNDSPRTYSLQKIVEIAYYNMNRVRFEWTRIWEVMGEHFNRVGCHNNTNIVFFALDALRQLSMNFLDLEELPGFKFQKDFLKPFEHILSNARNISVKDMVLRCLIQMIQARGDKIKSGWRTMFGVFTVAAREQHEAIVNLAYENVSQVYKTKFGVVISQGAFTDLIVCLTEFSKNMRFQKKSLQALETLKSLIPKMLKTPECPLSNDGAHDKEQAAKGPDALQRKQNKTTVEEGYWFPVLFAFHDVLMTGEDLEVRSNALEYFFEALLKYGGEFPPEFWDILWRQQLYPIFMVLRSRPDLSSALNHEELSVWLSTTMIQALRNMITLFTHYFDALEYMLDRFLELLALCICQENDTISRIGSNCLQQLILKNVAKFTPEHWAKIVGAFCQLFARTEARELFAATTINSTASLDLPSKGFEFSGPLSPTAEEPNEKSLKINGTDKNGGDAETASVISTADARLDEEERTPTGNGPLEEFKPSSNLQQQPVVVTATRRKYFNRIISKCVLQLLMIETVNELFSNENVYAQIPSTELLRLMALLKQSYLFARRFNADKELRMRLWREGFMKQAPNLLKQESGAAATYVAILFRMYADNSDERAAARSDIEKALVPLCKDIIGNFVNLEEDSQHRNIVAWRPVVVDVLEGYAAFPEESFVGHVKEFYPMVVELLAKDLSPELRGALLLVLRRVGEVALGIEGMAAGAERNRSDSVASAATAETMDRVGGTPRIG